MIEKMLPFLNQNYWRDEAFSVLISQKSLSEIYFLTVQDVHPPLYYFLLHYWIRIFSDAEYATRSLSLIFHILLVISCFYLLKHLLKSFKLALLPTAAILLNPFLITYAFETRAYMLFAFLVATATLFYLKKRFILSSLFLSFIILTHNFGIFFLIAFASYWIYEQFQQKTAIKQRVFQFTQIFFFPFITLLWWFRFLWNQWLNVASGYWIQTRTSSIIVDTFRAFFQGLIEYKSKLILYNLTLVLVFLGLFYWLLRLFNSIKNKNHQQNTILVFLFLIPFLLVDIVSSLWNPIFYERFLIPVLPVFIIWITYSLIQLSKVNKLFSYSILIFSITYLLFAWQSAKQIVHTTNKPPISQVLTKAESGDVIIPKSYLNYLEIKYYVLKSGKDISVLIYSPRGKKDIPFYVGKVLIENQDVITEYPENKNIWILNPDGSYLSPHSGSGNL